MPETLNRPKTVAVNMKLPREMVEAIAETIKANPIEFRTAADFYRAALTRELQRRGAIRKS